MSKLVEPKQVMTFLNQLFTKFDRLVDVFGVQKVETAGDCCITSSLYFTYIPHLSHLFRPRHECTSVPQVETAGDCYIAACGILSGEEGFSVVGESHDAKDSARRVMAFAKSIMVASKEV